MATAHFGYAIGFPIYARKHFVKKMEIKGGLGGGLFMCILCAPAQCLVTTCPYLNDAVAAAAAVPLLTKYPQ